MGKKDMDGRPMNTRVDEVVHLEVVFVEDMYNGEGNVRREMHNIKNDKLKN